MRSAVQLLVVGAGMAGSEAAHAAARAGIAVRLVEMKPEKRSPAHTLPGPAELVCSNSFGSLDPATASGLLKAEMRLIGSLILDAAEVASVPAGGTLAVDRVALSGEVDRRLREAGVECSCEETTALPETPCVVATGPLTSEPLAEAIREAAGAESLFFFDATSPIVDAETIDRSRIFAQSRWDKGDADYLNCPMTEEEYRAFVRALLVAEKVTPHAFEDTKLFEACQPIEDIAASGPMTLAFGPMRPVGLHDPHTGRRPFAVVQLRREDGAGASYSLVGFQTRMKWPDQRRVFHMIPGLEQAEFLRLGVIHRNTYVDGPRVLDGSLRMRARPHVRLAGQMTGVEGYVESAACGLMAGLFAAAEFQGRELAPPPETTMLGALVRHVTSSATQPFMPMNANFGLLPPIQSERRVSKAQRRAALVERAMSDLKTWMDASRT